MDVHRETAPVFRCVPRSVVSRAQTSLASRAVRLVRFSRMRVRFAHVSQRRFFSACARRVIRQGRVWHTMPGRQRSHGSWGWLRGGRLAQPERRGLFDV